MNQLKSQVEIAYQCDQTKQAQVKMDFANVFNTLEIPRLP